MSDARNLGETAIVGLRGQPSAEIVRVGCAKPIGETAMVRLRGQPSAEIVRVGCAKPRRNCVTRGAWSTLCGDRACRMCEMYAVPLGHWNALIFVFANVSYETLGRSLCQFLRMSRTKRSFWKVLLSVFANVSYETLILEALFVSFGECLVQNAHFGRSLCQFLRMSRTKRSFWKLSLSIFANVSYETLILEALFVSFCECLVRNAHFGRSLCQFLRMSRTKRSFSKFSLSVFANVLYETLILEGLFVSFCECLVRNVQFLRMSRTKRSFWKLSLSVFANVSYKTLILEGLFLSFCECLVRNAHFGRSLCQFLRMSRTKRSFWKVSLSVFANVSYETLILEALFVSFCECLVRNAHFGSSLCQFLRMSRTKRSFWKVSFSVFANVSYETLILEGLFVCFCECLVRNAHFARSLCQFLRMSRTKRSFWKVSLSVFANVSYETLILKGLFVSFCECLVRNAPFGRSLCQFLRMSRTKRSFWKVSLSVFANVSYETLLLKGLFVSFCECLVRNAHFGRSLCQFLRMSRTKRSFWKLSLSVFANVSYETLILEGLFVSFCECLVRNAHFGRSFCQFLRMSRTKRSFWKLSLSVFANVSYETLILEGLFLSFCECLVRNAHFGRSLCQFLRMSRTKRSFCKVSLSVFICHCFTQVRHNVCKRMLCSCLCVFLLVWL